MSEADQVLTIDVVSDVVCPWCYLGEKRLEKALSEDAGPVVVRWRPYQLDPTIPEGGLDRTEYMEKKFGKSGRLQSAHENLTRLGAEVGVPFAFDKIRRSPNTLDALGVQRAILAGYDWAAFPPASPLRSGPNAWRPSDPLAGGHERRCLTPS